MADQIVVGTDGSDTAKRAVEEAVRIARALDAELHVVTAYETARNRKIVGAPKGQAAVYDSMPDSEAEAILGQAAVAGRGRDVSVTTHAVRRDPVDALLEVAEKVGATMIVVGSKGMHGARRLALGNVPNQVSHKARCNVLIVNTDV